MTNDTWDLHGMVLLKAVTSEKLANRSLSSITVFEEFTFNCDFCANAEFEEWLGMMLLAKLVVL